MAAVVANIQGPPGPPGEPGVTVKGVLDGADTPLPPNPELGDLWIVGPEVPTVVPDPVTDYPGGGGSGGGGGGGDVTPESISAVRSSTAGDNGRLATAVVYSPAGFANATKNATTFYVIPSPDTTDGSVYLGAVRVSGPAVIVPNAPTGLFVSAGDTQVTLTWNAPPGNGGLATSGYKVQRSLTPTTGFVTVQITPANVRTHISTGLTNGLTYYFRVVAVNPVGDGPPSAVSSVIPVAGTVTTLSSSDTSVDSGTSITFTARVTTEGNPVPLGTVTFKRNGNTIISGVPLTAGTATLTIATLPIGSWQMTAAYDGAGVYPNSTSNTVSQDVTFAGGPAPTIAVLTSSDATSAVGQSVTFTLTVTRASDGVPVTGGTAIFRDGGTAISGALVVNATTGTVSFTTTSLSEATHTITADYSGAPIYQNIASNPVTQDVVASTGSTPVYQNMLSSKPTAATGEVLTVRTTIFDSYSNEPVTSGTVTFYDGAAPLGPGTPINLFGESAFTTYALATGTHQITAHFAGAPFYDDDVSTTLIQTIAATITPPAPTDWQTAFDSNNLATITAWYDYYTGHLTGGFTNASLWNPGGPGAIDQVSITPSWLAANEGPNVVNDGSGHWTITGLHTAMIQIRTSHLTFNHCWIERRDYANVWGALVLVFDPTTSISDNATNTDITLNYCTISTDGTGAEGTYGDAVLFDPVTPKPNDMTFNYCEVTQVIAGFKANAGMTVNYCWVHDLDLFGFDPHNTAGSIRDRQCRFNRNLFTDGTSSDVSLYADNTPYTDFWVTDNTMWVNPAHAAMEVNFPLRGTGFSPLLPGYVREFTGNKLEKGLAGDNNYWSKISGNTLITGEPLFGGADTDQIPNKPTTLSGTSTGIVGLGVSQTLTTYHYTPSPSSTLLAFHAAGRAGHVADPATSISDESGAAWFLVPGGEIPVEAAPANTVQYGLSGSLWTQESPPGTQAFRRITIDPYATASAAYMAALVVEITNHTNLTLAQPAVQSAAGHASPFGANLPSISSGVLAHPATAGNIVMLFIGFNHEVPGGLSAPAGWHLLGNNSDIRTSAACLWRDDFTGRSVTVPDVAEANLAVTVLIEVVVPS